MQNFAPVFGSSALSFYNLQQIAVETTDVKVILKLITYNQRDYLLKKPQQNKNKTTPNGVQEGEV